MKTVLYFSTGSSLLSPTRIAGMTRFAKAKGWSLVPRSAYKMPFDEQFEFWHPIGCILDNGNDVFEGTIPSGVPMVWLSRDPALLKPDEYLVDQDSFQTGRLAADELVGRGLVHFAYVGFHERQWWSSQRCEGFSARLGEHGMEPPDCFEDARGGRSRREALCAFLAALPRPCGVFCATDGTAEEVIVSCNALRIAVPDEMPVLGVDDYESVCEGCAPTLTSVNPDFELGGYLAAQLLSELIDGQRPERHVVWHPPRGVVRRQSTQRLVRFDRRVSAALEYIRVNIEQGLSVAQVVDRMGCSRRQAEKLFRDTTGDTVLRAINTALFERACRLLEQHRLQVRAVADRLRISPTAMRRIFVDRTGLNPLRWVKMREETIGKMVAGGK